MTINIKVLKFSLFGILSCLILFTNIQAKNKSHNYTNQDITPYCKNLILPSLNNKQLKIIENTVCKISIDDLRPMQYRVGFASVAIKAHKLDYISKGDVSYKYKSITEFLKDDEVVPIIIGPTSTQNKLGFYMTDKHHGMSAFYLWQKNNSNDYSSKDVFATIIKDYRDLNTKDFTDKLITENLVYNYDIVTGDNKNIFDADFPKHVSNLKFDVYRDALGLARKYVFFSSPDIPFYQFIWARCLKDNIANSLPLNKFEQINSLCKLNEHGSNLNQYSKISDFNYEYLGNSKQQSSCRNLIYSIMADVADKLSQPEIINAMKNNCHLEKNLIPEHNSFKKLAKKTVDS